MPLDLSKSFSEMGSAGHHIYGHGTNPMGKITEHGHVWSGGHKIGTIEHNGTIRDRAHRVVGRIDEHGHVHTKWSSDTQFFASGHEIRDNTGAQVGHSAAGSLGGAAMLLMLNKDR